MIGSRKGNDMTKEKELLRRTQLNAQFVILKLQEIDRLINEFWQQQKDMYEKHQQKPGRRV